MARWTWGPLAVGLVVGLAACSSSPDNRWPTVTAGASGAMTGVAGTSGEAGTTGTAGTTGIAGAPDAGDAAGPADASRPEAGLDEPTTIVPTVGCGTATTQALGVAVRGTIQTMGSKPPTCADSKCGDWSYEREYYLTLPKGYVATKAYPLVFEAPGCSGHGNNLYSNVFLDGSVIRVGLTPPPNEIGHAAVPNQGCFDDHDGDASVDWVFYETLYDQLAGQVCFDRNRVFAAGNSSGGWFANELGCKYAGDTTRPVRGVMVNSGGWPTDAAQVPTCTNKPMAGFWSHGTANTSAPFTRAVVVMNRALAANGCTPTGVTYATATFDPYPIAGNYNTCKKFKGCPDLYPVVICPTPADERGDMAAIVGPGWTKFVQVLSTPPLLTQ